MNIFRKIIVFVFTAGLVHGLFAGSVVFNQLCNIQVNSNALKTSNCVFKSYSNISICENSNMNFNGKYFGGKSINGKGVLILNGSILQLQLNSVNNIIVVASITHLNSNIVVNDGLIINNNSELILYNFDLLLPRKSYENVISAIVENGTGKVIISNNKSYFNPDRIVEIINQLRYNNITGLENNYFIIFNNFNILNNTEKNIVNYIHQLPAPLYPPPKKLNLFT